MINVRHHVETIALVAICSGTLGSGAERPILQRAPCFDTLNELADGLYTDEDESPGSDHDFDARFENPLSGGRFSCDIYIRASEARRALDLFRSGVLYDDQRDIEASVAFPLPVRVRPGAPGSDAPSELFELENFEEWLAFKNQYFTELHIAMISCANVRNVVTRVGRAGYGFTIGPGTVWFKERFLEPDADPPGVSVSGINLVLDYPEEWIVGYCTGRFRN